MITFDELRFVLRYDAETGLLYWLERPRWMFNSDPHWKMWNSRFAGKLAGTKSHGYALIRINKKPFRAHRLIWALVHGEWPPMNIDHINGDRSDNRIENLRVVPQNENMKNAKRRIDSTSGVTGVNWHKHRNKWHARIKARGRYVSLGYFERLDEAAAARKAGEKQYGYHPNHGRAALERKPE